MQAEGASGVLDAEADINNADNGGDADAAACMSDDTNIISTPPPPPPAAALRTTSTRMTRMAPNNLHDWLALGEVEVGLGLSQSSRSGAAGGGGGGDSSSPPGIAAMAGVEPSSTAAADHFVSYSTTTTTTNTSAVEEVRRLPMLLRLLSAARPLAPIPTIRVSSSSSSSSSLQKQASSDTKKKNAEEGDEEEEEEGKATTHDHDDDAGKTHRTKDETDDRADEECCDPLIEDVVNRLEDRAALYSAAEGIEVVTSYLAPYVCRKLSRLPPLNKKKTTTASSHTSSAATGATTTEQQQRGEHGSNRSTTRNVVDDGMDYDQYDTTDLEVMAKNPISTLHSLKTKTTKAKKKCNKRKRTSSAEVSPTPKSGGGGGDQGNNDDDDNDDDGDETSGDEMDVPAFSSATTAAAAAGGSGDGQQRAQQLHRQGSIRCDRESFLHMSQEDSQEAQTAKILSELATLVVQSLKEPIRDEDGEPILSLVVDDYILSEADAERGTNEATDTIGGALTGCDLGSTVAALMHHSPVLTHARVARALCRAAIPRAPELISHMGANCPGVVPCLLKGCIDVYRQAQKRPRRYSSIVKTTRNAVLALANLSDREGARVLTTLQQSDLCIDMQLELAMSLDPVAAACLMLEELSSSEHMTRRNDNVQSAIRRGSLTGKGGELDQMCRDSESEIRSNEVSLLRHLEESPVMLGRILEFLARQLSLARTAFDDPRCAQWGRMCLFLSAYCSLLVRIDMSGVSDSEESKAVVRELVSLTELMSKTIQLQEDSTRAGSNGGLDRPFGLVLASSVAALAWTFVPYQTSSGGDASGRELCAQCIGDLFALPALSQKTSALTTRVAAGFKSIDAHALRDLAEELLSRRGHDKSNLTGKHESEMLLDRLVLACEWASTSLDLDSSIEAMERDGFSIDHSALLQLPELGTERIKETIQEALADPEKCISLLQRPFLPSFVEDVVMLLLKANEPGTPVVSPVQIEMLVSGIILHPITDLGANEAQFLMHLLYCFAYLELSPSSAFAFDPRSMPLTDVYRACDTLPPNSLHYEVRIALKAYINRYCPEISDKASRVGLLRSSRHIVLSQDHAGSPSDYHMRRNGLLLQLRKSVSKPGEDPSGLLAEKEYIRACFHLSEADLMTTTVSALLSPSKAPPLTFTYASLCRDPMAILKCPLSVWRLEGVRRIVLHALTCLLETNDALARELSSDDIIGEELIAARNEVLVRCLLSTLSPSSPQLDHGQRYCSMTVGLIRKTVAGQDGLAAMLLKQRLPEHAFDWLVEFIPEAGEDTAAFVGILNEKKLSPAERLVAADSILRVTVAHGHRKSGVEIDALVYSALSQFIASFFLIIGPVGVPASSLIGAEGTGLDATQLSRRATFRMLKCLSKVRSYRTGIQNECQLFLQKFSGLCKGEGIIGGVSNAVGNRQKKLLKELLDAIALASNTIGSFRSDYSVVSK